MVTWSDSPICLPACQACKRASWQVLFLDHRVENLALGGPWLLGTVKRDLSAWSVVPQADMAALGGSSHRRLFGCVITMLDVSFAVPGSVLPVSVPNSHGEVDGSPVTACTSNFVQQRLLTWSKVSVYQLHFLLSTQAIGGVCKV